MIKSAFASHQGYVREKQEDAYGQVEKNFFVVADGLGGMPAGEEAAKAAVKTAQKVFRQKKASQSVKELLTQVFKKADAAIKAEASKNPNKQGMCTTMVAALISDKKWWIANIGDSRGYFFSASRDNCKNRFIQVTDDHEDSHGIITRALGHEEEAIPDIFEGEAEPGDMLLLATDGLFELVADQEMENILSEKKSVQEKAERLVKKALEAGGWDNVTVGIVEWQQAT